MLLSLQHLFLPGKNHPCIHKVVLIMINICTMKIMECPDGWGNIPRATTALVRSCSCDTGSFPVIWLGSDPVLVGACSLVEHEAPDTVLLVLYLTSHEDIMDAGMESSNPVRLINPVGLVMMAFG